MNRLVYMCVGLLLILPGSAKANLLTNGDFNTTLGAEWTIWGDLGWVNQEIPSITPALQGVYDGTLQMSLGDGDNNGSRGMFQTVAGTAGLSYTLDIQAGAQDWWWPNGSAYLIFLDVGDAVLASHEIDTTAGISNFDVGLPYQDFSISAVAPAGTTQVKVEMAEWNGTGTAWFDNASLTAVPEPSSLMLVGLACMATLCGSRRR